MSAKSKVAFLAGAAIIWLNLKLPMNNIPPIAPLPAPIPPIAPLPANQRNIDTDHLNLLSIFHLVGAGLAFLGMLFLPAHYAMMHFMFNNPAFWQDQNHQPPPPQFLEMFKVFIWFYLAMGLWFLASIILNILSGLFLRARKYRTFSFVVAGINCLHIPLGTILGIFTILVLTRVSVRDLYEEARFR